MATLPSVGPGADSSPHVVILGAGASRATCPAGDRNGRILPVMNDLVALVGLTDLLVAAGLENETNVEAAYDTLARSGRHEGEVRELERRIRDYFSAIELPDEPTVYDRLLLGLRPNDLVATFNWDPLLIQAVRRNRREADLPSLVFVHGVVGLGYCFDHGRYGPVGEGCDTCGTPLAETPILYPVRDKSYSGDRFIKRQMNNLRYKLRNAYLLTVFGYGAPQTDVLARELLLDAWGKNETRELAQVEIIDIREEAELRQSWDEFITRSHYGVLRSFDESFIAEFPRRSCEGLFMATLQNTPWHDNRYPAFESLAELQRWVQPLVEEERRLKGAGQFSGTPCTRP